MHQLEQLMSLLYSVEPHYVRCIKSNPLKKPGIFHGGLCLEQLNYSGVFEAVLIRQSGYPFRMIHEEFILKYKVIALDLDKNLYNEVIINLNESYGKKNKNSVEQNTSRCQKLISGLQNHVEEMHDLSSDSRFLKFPVVPGSEFLNLYSVAV